MCVFRQGKRGEGGVLEQTDPQWHHLTIISSLSLLLPLPFLLLATASHPNTLPPTETDGDAAAEEGRKRSQDNIELEDTLKAVSDPERMGRNMSSPPGIGGEAEEEEDQVQPLASSSQEVQLREKIPASHSMDAITKVQGVRVEWEL